MHIKLSPSILNADFGRLAEQVSEAEAAGADYLHVDVMDGQFVPNISLGPAVVAAIRKATTIPLDLHLMIEEPRRFLPEFVAAGAGIMTVHAEAVRHLHATVAAIQDAGVRAGVALNPATPLSVVEEIVDRLDLLLRRFEERAPEIVFEWHDVPTGARGWVVINSLRGGAAGGGTRMRKGPPFPTGRSPPFMP